MATKITKNNTKENLAGRIVSLKANLKKYNVQQGLETDSDIKAVLLDKIETLEVEITDLQDEYDALNAQKVKADEASLANVIMNNNIAYIASDDKYILIRDYSKTEKKVNLDIRTLSKIEIQGVLNVLSRKPGAFDELNAVAIRRCFEMVNRSFLIKTSSFDEDRWNGTEVYNTILEQKTFWAPIDRGDDYHPVFDELMYSLGGGKQENIDHIEQWVAFKYMYPEKCKTQPGLNITGVPGGNGKGMFTDLLRSIFTGQGVALIRAKSLTGGFNQGSEGKVITVLDDEKKDKFPTAELKQAQGNSSTVIEPKGVDAYTVDNTATMIILDNTGLVQLVGGGSAGEDRRWSIILTELTLLECLQKRWDMSEIESKEFAQMVSDTIFADRIECGKWVAHCIKKWDIVNKKVLAPLHGADYTYRLANQKDSWTMLFDEILPIVVNQGVIPFEFIKQIVELKSGVKINKVQTLSSKFDEYLSRKGFKGVEKTDINISIGFGSKIKPTKFKGAVRRLNPDAVSFDYSLISNVPYVKALKLTEQTMSLRDFDNSEVEEIEMEDDDSAFEYNAPSYESLRKEQV